MNETTFNKKTRLTSSVSLVFISYIHNIIHAHREIRSKNDDDDV